jgi:tetratricopeptide (TPR) repeat protein
MEFQKIIGLIILGCVGVWFYRSYEPEIQQKWGNAQQTEVDPFIKAEALFHTFQYDEAVEAYHVAIARGLPEPRLQEAYFRIAVALDKSHRKREALAAYQEAVRRYPGCDQSSRAYTEIERLRIDTGQ